MAQQINRKGVANIMNGRTLVPASKVGRTVTLTIQGNGNVVDVKDKEGHEVESYLGGGDIFRKKIFNCKANSEVAMAAAPNRELLKAALAEDKAGNADKAAELFGQYLNKVQLSFNIPLPSPLADKIGDRDEISAKVVMITTDNGSILTLDAKSIKVLEPEVLGATKFSLPDEEEEDDAPESDRFDTMDRPALIKEAKVHGIKTKDKSDDDIRKEIRVALLEAEEA